MDIQEIWKVDKQQHLQGNVYAIYAIYLWMFPFTQEPNNLNAFEIRSLNILTLITKRKLTLNIIIVRVAVIRPLSVMCYAEWGLCQ